MAALIVIVVPVTFVTVVPAVTPATSTISPTEMFVLASTTIVVAPAATAPLLRTWAPKPSASTKFISPPLIASVVLALSVTVVPEIAETVAPEAIPVPNTASPTAILVASATTRLVELADAVPVV